MMWLYAYLAIGALSGSFYAIKDWLGRLPSASREVLKALDEPKSRKEQFISVFVEPVVIVLGVLIGWPFLWWMQIQDWREKSRRVPYKFDEPFKLKASDLIAQTNIQAVEQGAFVKDPLGAVPPLPFGHLNAAWNKFLHARPNGAALWTFESEELIYGGNCLQLLSGYVWVAGQTLQPLFLTQESLTPVDEENI